MLIVVFIELLNSGSSLWKLWFVSLGCGFD